jgi:D-arabinose 1-dehydrogenase-like Zn-dependent alcohol dehydrogenase
VTDALRGRTAVLREYLKPIEIQEYDVPDPEPGAMVLRILQAGVCGSDMHAWRGDQAYRALPPTGRPFGHEGVGIVHSLGKGLTSDFTGEPLREGDRVVFAAVFSCGRCMHCLRGDHNLCATRSLTYKIVTGEAPYFVNTYADYCYLPAGHPVFRVPDELSDDVLVSVNCAVGTVLQGLMLAQVTQGQTVVVQGTGGLGLYAVALAKDMGASCVVAIDTQPARLSLATALGADQVIDINDAASPNERVARVHEITGQRGADVVVELVGLRELVAEGIDMLGPGGTYVEIGNLMRGRTAVIEPSALLKTKHILGSIMYRPSIMPTAIDFLVRNHKKIPLASVISHHFPLEEINQAFERAEWAGRSTDVIRAALVP